MTRRKLDSGKLMAAPLPVLSRAKAGDRLATSGRPVRELAAKPAISSWRRDRSGRGAAVMANTPGRASIVAEARGSGSAGARQRLTGHGSCRVDPGNCTPSPSQIRT